MKPGTSKLNDLPAFDREAVFAAVDRSTDRFETYTKEQREQFVKQARELRAELTKAAVHESLRGAGH